MSVVKPVRAPQTRVAVVGDELQVGGVSRSLLVERVGSTPFFAYDRTLLPARVGLVRAALPARVRLHYSIKANPMTALVQHMAHLVDGLDVALAQELRIALDTGGKPAGIAFARPRKIDAELRQALAFGICINLELPGETDTVARLACDLRPRGRYAPLAAVFRTLGRGRAIGRKPTSTVNTNRFCPWVCRDHRECGSAVQDHRLLATGT